MTSPVIGPSLLVICENTEIQKYRAIPCTNISSFAEENQGAYQDSLLPTAYSTYNLLTVFVCFAWKKSLSNHVLLSTCDDVSVLICPCTDKHEPIAGMYDGQRCRDASAGLPLVMTALWAAVTAVYHQTQCWWGYSFTPYYWVLEGPRFTVIAVSGRRVRLTRPHRHTVVLIAHVLYTEQPALEHRRSAGAAGVTLDHSATS